MKHSSPSIHPIPFNSVNLGDAFWSPRIETNRTVTIPFAIARCEETGRFDNFAVAGGLKKGAFRGIYYDDSDVFKVIEGIAYSLATHPDAELDAYLDGVIEKITAAQEDDGYLYTNRTIDPQNTAKAAGPDRWSNLKDSHELYNVGHLYEAAVAHFRATGKRSLLEVALKNAALLFRTFGPQGRRDPPGHQEIEIGLAKLSVITGERRYLDLGRFFLDQRGHYHNGRPGYGTYAQDHQPVVEQTAVVGHAVRALYMYSGMADVAALSGDQTYLPALDALWEDMVGRKMALTGGIGARKQGEAFGEPYELPNHTSYNETCASIASVLWNHRMFLLSGQGKYLDVMERTLYNGLLVGVSLSGDRFFYINPLASDGKTPFNYGGETGRAPWFKCSCCPVNIVRFMASLGGYVFSATSRCVHVHLYAAGTGEIELPEAGRVRLTQQTNYPWDGRVRLTVDPQRDATEFEVRMRIPGWAQGRPVPGDLYRYIDGDPEEPVKLAVNGQPVEMSIRDGFAVIQRPWRTGDEVMLDLPMPVRRVLAHERVTENTGLFALERGPLVYCLEQADNDGDIAELSLADSVAITSEHQPELLGGVTVLRSASGLTAVPYHAWNHRGPGAMAVWLKRG